ncbi:S8 family serine peptidase [bacterium]|nr:S8 family serine peptidase [bacterium]NCQ54756.1 S8 family serine peptidase [Candidatus Parcubacteria bacterium]NCS68009.1 S8 family serine peptidase [Candidatus Peregrinibacteria bacterium]NCS95746.1 S8 family serine peptidase [bacterium]
MKKIQIKHSALIIISLCVVACLAFFIPNKNFLLASVLNTSQDENQRIIVKFKQNLNNPNVKSLLSKYNLRTIKTVNTLNLSVISVPKENVNRVKLLLNANPTIVDYTETDILLSPFKTPNDRYYASQWHHRTINSAGAWDIQEANDITIAIADSGIEASHPDLQGRVLTGLNTVDNSNDTSDIHGHGTAVAGTAAAIGNNSEGVVGMSYNAKILPIKVSNESNGSAYLSDIIDAIDYATLKDAKVLNISYGPLCASRALADATAYRHARNGVTVISAGNSGTEYDCQDDPNAIYVSATGKNDVKTDWSSYGPFVDVAAPGEGIVTTGINRRYGTVSGTSFSAPLTTGLVALAWSVNPNASNQEIEAALFKMSEDKNPAGRDNFYGHGRIDAAKTVQAIKDTLSSVPSTPSNPNSEEPSNNSEASSVQAEANVKLESSVSSQNGSTSASGKLNLNTSLNLSLGQ